MTTQEMRQRRAALIAEARGLVEERAVDGVLGAEDTAQYDAIMAKVDELAANVRRLEQLDEAAKSAPAAAAVADLRGGRDTGEDREAAYLSQFRSYLQTGLRAAMEVGTAGEGGYLVPVLYSTQLSTALTEMSIMRMAGARVITVGGSKAFKAPTMIKSAAAVLTDEEGNTDEKEPTFDEVEFVPYKYTKLIKASEELVADSPIDLMSQVLLPDAAQAFAAAENTAFAIGNGTTAPQGITVGGTVGKTAAAVNAITADELIDLYHALPYMYRQNAKWFMNDLTAGAARKLIDGTGQYMWQPGLQAGQPDRLLGSPVVTMNGIETMAAGKKVIAFGDVAYFWITDFGAQGMQRLNELYAFTGQVGFRWWRRFDSNVMVAEAIQVLQMHA